jgi:hypothetical protein
MPEGASRVTVVSGGGYFQGRLDIVTSSDEGKTWSAPVTAIDGPDDDRNPAFGQLRNGDILLAYAIIHGYDETGLKLKARQRNERQVDGVYVV